MATDRQEIISFAQAQLGKPYVWGAEGPNSYDCSGLIYAAYTAAGLKVQRVTAATLGDSGHAVSQAEASPGDVVYYDWPGATDHVGIYIGNGQMINAPTQGEPVQVAPIGNPTSIRRMIDENGKPLPPEEIGDVFSDMGDVAAGAVDALNPFSGWQSDAVAIGVKILAAGAAVALVIVGAKEALSDSKGTAA
jgi:hypothetical protein